MKTLLVSILRALPRPLVVTAGFLGIVTALVAAMTPITRAPADGDELVFTAERMEEQSEQSGEELPAVSFAMPVHFAAPPPAAEPAPAVVAENQSEDEAARVLQAIAEVETRSNPNRVGSLGERGMYQFRRDTWRQHTREPFARAHHPEISTTVARRHYQWLKKQLRTHGRPATTYEVALAWNAGVTNVLSGRAPASSHAYARRVVTLAANS